MPTIVEQTIGTGGTFATINDWWNAVPTDLVAIDSVYRGLMLGQEFTSVPEFSGKVTDSTRYPELTAQVGASWCDAPANAIRYGFGARIRLTSDFSPVIKGSQSGSLIKLPISRIQIKNDGAAGVIDSVNYLTNFFLNKVLAEGPLSGNEFLSLVSVSPNDGAPVNCVFIKTGAGAAGSILFTRAGAKGTFLVNLGGNLSTFIQSDSSANVPFVNCGIFGAATSFSTGSSSLVFSGCASNFASLPNGVFQTAFSTTTGAKYNNISPGTHDLRISAGSALIDAGVTDTSLSPDLYGTVRSAPYDIGPIEVAAAGVAPILSIPTRSTPTNTTVAPGFTTDTPDGTARGIVIRSATAPTTPSIAQVKAGLNAAGTSTGVTALSNLAITTTGVKTFAATTVTAGGTDWPFIVHTSAAAVDSLVLTGLAHYPGTVRPVTDVVTTNWTVTGAATFSAAINEDTSNRSTFVQGPMVSVTPSMITHDLDKAYPAGTYSFSIDADISAGTGRLRLKLMNAANAVLGTSADQTLTMTPQVFTFNITVAGGTATRLGIETQSL